MFQGKLKQYFVAQVVVFLICIVLSPTASALLTISFMTNGFIPKGALITQANNNSETVQLANNKSPYGFLGVVTKGGQTTVLVAQSGVVGMLVSNINGSINTGSKLTLSTLSGIAVKYNGQGPVIGIARSSFNGTGMNVANKVIKGPNGNSHDVKIGAITASIDINANYNNQKSLLPTSPAALAGTTLGSFVGHQISSTRVFISLIVLGVGLLLVIIVFFVAVTNGIKAISRNPLAAQLIIKNTSKILLYDFVLFIITLLIIYIIVTT